MGRDGKYAYGSGRARQTHQRDRAQLEFDDMLIDDFIDDFIDDGSGHASGDAGDHVGGGVGRSAPGRSEIPVHFGTRQLAEFLDDSAIAAALIRGELPEMDPDVPLLSVGSLDDQGLFDLAADARVSPVAPIAKRIPVATQRTPTATITPATPTTPITSEPAFTLGGVMMGFALGAASAAALLLVAWALL